MDLRHPHPPIGGFGPFGPEVSRGSVRESVPENRSVKGRRDTPQDTPSDTPIFGDTLSDTPWDTLGLKGPKPSVVSGLQKGLAERGHVKKRQKSSKSVKKLFDTFRQFSRRAKKRQKMSKSFSTLFDNFRAAPFFWPLLGAPM